MQVTAREAAVAPVSDLARKTEVLPPRKQVTAFVSRGGRGVEAPLLPPWDGKTVGRK